MLLSILTLPVGFRPPPHPAPPLGRNSPSCRLLALRLGALSSRWEPVKDKGRSCSSLPLVSGMLGRVNGWVGERQHQPGARERTRAPHRGQAGRLRIPPGREGGPSVRVACRPWFSLCPTGALLPSQAAPALAAVSLSCPQSPRPLG